MVVAIVRVARQPSVGVALAVEMVVVMPVTTMVAMIVSGTVPMMMAVIMLIVMIMAMRVRGISAAHRREGFDDVRHSCPQSLKHVLDDMVAQDKDALSGDGGCQVPVADMPGKLGQMNRVARSDVIEFFGGCPDLDLAAVLQHQKVAVGEGRRFQQVDQHLAAVDEFYGASAQMPLVMRQNGSA